MEEAIAVVDDDVVVVVVVDVVDVIDVVDDVGVI